MPNRSRREFLEDSMFATAAALAATSAANAVAGEKNAVKKIENKSPNEKLSVAVVGVNGRGRSHIGGFANQSYSDVTYICDPDEKIGMARVADVAKKQGGRKPKYVKDIREVCDDKSVDLISIATPNHWHALGAIWALQAGKDVYVEKPVSHNVSEGRRIVEAARKYNRICQTGTQSRSMSGMQEIIKFIHEGGIGEVTLARGLCYKRRKSIGPKGKYEVPKHVDYNLWAGPASNGPLTRSRLHYDWHWDYEYGNGDLGNQGIHQMDIARWGLGLEGLCKGVISYGGRFGYEDAGNTANTQVAIHDYGDKTLVFEVRGLDTKDYKGAKIGVIFTGTEGYVSIPSYSGGTAFDKDGKVIKKFSGGGDHFANCVKAIRSRKVEDLNGDILEGHLSSALCHLSNIPYQVGSEVSAAEALERLSSIKTNENVKDTFERTRKHLADNKVDLNKGKLRIGPWLNVDPKTETFVNNSQADRFLTREYRAPFVVPAAGKV